MIIIHGKNFNGSLIGIKCPIGTCDESFIVPYLPLHYKLRCSLNDDYVDIIITTEGEIKVFRNNKHKEINKWIIMMMKMN